MKVCPSKERPEFITGERELIKARLEQVRLKKKIKKQWNELGLEVIL